MVSKVKCCRGQLGRELWHDAHWVGILVDFWRFGWSSFREGLTEASVQRVPDGMGCEEAEIRSLDDFFNKLNWGGKKGERERERLGEF